MERWNVFTLSGTLDPVLDTDCLAVANVMASIGAEAGVGVVLKARHADKMTVLYR